VRAYVNSHVINRLKPEWVAGKQQTAARGEASRILIVDDEASSRLGFRVALEVAGYGVTEAEDGEQALEHLRGDPADLALLDLQMPLLNGMETLQCLRDEGIDVPVVVVTAHGSVPSAVQAMKLGAIDFLAKPVAPAALRQTVFEVLVRRANPGAEPYRPAPTSLGVTAHRFAEGLALARRALNQRQFAVAEALLQQVIDLDPGSTEAHTLLGVLHESLGEDHAAYRSYRTALTHDRHYGPALDGMKRYCERSGLDFNNRNINPGAD
jgi:DNA-binding response OmpR family regulator